MSCAALATARKNSSASLVLEAADLARAAASSPRSAQNGRPGDVDRARRARLVHRHDRVAVADDARAVAERLVERLAEHDPGVLDGVVRAGLQVAGDASTSRSSRPWRASRSSMWSRKPTPVLRAPAPRAVERRARARRRSRRSCGLICGGAASRAPILAARLHRRGVRCEALGARAIGAPARASARRARRRCAPRPCGGGSGAPTARRRSARRRRSAACGSSRRRSRRTRSPLARADEQAAGAAHARRERLGRRRRRARGARARAPRRTRAPASRSRRATVGRDRRRRALAGRPRRAAPRRR